MNSCNGIFCWEGIPDVTEDLKPNPESACFKLKGVFALDNFVLKFPFSEFLFLLKSYLIKFLALYSSKVEYISFFAVWFLSETYVFLFILDFTEFVKFWLEIGVLAF